MKGPRTDYDGEILADNPQIRRWVWEHAVTLERILFRLEEAGLTASGTKLVVIVPKLTIIGTVVSKDGKEMADKKLSKLFVWPTPTNISELRRWYGLYNYLRDFAEGTKEAEGQIRRKLAKGNADQWEWTDEDDKALTRPQGRTRARRKTPNDRLRDQRGNHPFGGFFEDGSWDRTLASRQGWSAQPIRFDSIPFTSVESRYSQPKLELAGVFKAIKKFRQYLYGTHFTLEIDARSLIQMINNPELPNAAMTRWVGYIKMFDFEIRHVPGKEHVIPDTLSCRDVLEGEEEETLTWMKAILRSWRRQFLRSGGGDGTSTSSRGWESAPARNGR